MESIGEVRAKLAEILRDNPDGLLGSEVKTMLRRALSSSFDESAYGFRSFASFLQEMGKVVKVVPRPRDRRRSARVPDFVGRRRRDR